MIRDPPSIQSLLLHQLPPHHLVLDLHAQAKPLKPLHLHPTTEQDLVHPTTAKLLPQPHRRHLSPSEPVLAVLATSARQIRILQTVLAM